jgi:hypothetical protein
MQVRINHAALGTNYTFFLYNWVILCNANRVRL